MNFLMVFDFTQFWLVMSIFEFLTKFLVFWHLWVCVRRFEPFLLQSGVTKGQTISKANYGVHNSPQKWTKNHYPGYFLKRRCSVISLIVKWFSLIFLWLQFFMHKTALNFHLTRIFHFFFNFFSIYFSIYFSFFSNLRRPWFWPSAISWIQWPCK